MKKLFLLSAIGFISLGVMAQAEARAQDHAAEDPWPGPVPPRLQDQGHQ